MSHLLISGGTRGIGKACVKLFADQGFKVSSLSRLGKPEDAIKGVSYYKCDVRNPSDVNRAVKASIKRTAR